MNTAMEMHDSYVLDVDSSSRGFILFHACVFRSKGRPGQGEQESGWQNVRMIFTDMVIEGTIKGSKPYTSDGFLSVDGVRDWGLIDFPVHYVGKVVLSMELSDDFATTTILASSVSIAAEGEFEIESVWDAQGNVTRAK